MTMDNESMIWSGQMALSITCLRFCLSGAFNESLSRFPCVFGLFTGSFVPLIRRKIHENVWYLLWHALSSCWNLSLLLKEPWFTNFHIDQQYVNYTSHFMSSDVRNFYLTSLAFWFSCCIYLGFETRRHDFPQMVCHHALTVSLILGSLALNFFRFGLVVLVIHDLVDVLLYLVKTFVYVSKKVTAMKILTDVFFVIFALAFFSLRIVAFPIFVILPAFSALRLGRLAAFPTMLSGLYCLHIYWFTLIVRIAMKNLREKKLDDARSETDSDAEKTKKQ